MKTTRRIIFFAWFTALSALAHAGAGNAFGGIHYYDSLLPESNFRNLPASGFLEVQDLENNFAQSRNMQKTLMKLIHIAGMKKALRSKTLGSRIFMDIANISTRLKMYSLAMKCYSRAIQLKREKRFYSDIVVQSAAENPDTLQNITTDSLELAGQSSIPLGESLPVLSRDIQQAFQDGKTGSSYALILHVKQPVYGKRKAFCHINNVGHTFITLIKLNKDNSTVSRSFGFYPAKKNFFAATPVHPGDQAMIRDDALHPWDETVAKFISEKKFNRILANLEKYSGMRYNLNRKNCTDFGLNEALIAGIEIKETSGRWPLGKGNNPGNAGQSLLEKKYRNTDDEFPEIFPVNENEIVFDDVN